MRAGLSPLSAPGASELNAVGGHQLGDRCVERRVRGHTEQSADNRGVRSLIEGLRDD